MPSSSSSSFATWGSRLLSLPRHGHNNSNNININNNNNININNNIHFNSNNINTHGQAQGGEGGQYAKEQEHIQGQGQASSELGLVLSVATPDSMHHGGLSTEACSNNMLDPSAAADAPTVATPLLPTSATLLSSSSESMVSSLSQHNHHHLHPSPPFLPSCPSSSPSPSPSPSSTPSSSASSSPQQHHSHYSQLQQQSQPPRIIAVEATTLASSPPTSEIYRSNYNNAIPVTSTTISAAGSILTSTTSATTPQLQPHSQPQLLPTAITPQQQQYSPSLSRASSTSSFFASSPPPDRPAPPPPRPPPPRPPLHSTSSSNIFLRRPTRNPFRTSSSSSPSPSSSSSPSNPTTVADPSLTSSNSSFSLRRKKKATTPTPTRQEQQKGLPPTPPHSSSRSPFAHSQSHSHSQQSAPRPPSIHSLTSSPSGSIKVTLSTDQYHHHRSAQTTPSSSLKGSITSSLFSIKRRRRLPLPFWTGDSSSRSPSPSSSDTDQEAPTPPPRPRPRLDNSSTQSSLSPSIQFPTTTTTTKTIMQQVEYMPDSTQSYHPMQQTYDRPSFHQGVSPLPLHPSSPSSSSSSSTTTTLQKQTLSSKRMRPPLSEISTASIPSSSTTLISSNANQRLLQEQQQQITPEYSPSSLTQHNKNTITRINPNQGSTEEDQVQHLHERARFVASSSFSPSSSTTQPPGQPLTSSSSSGLVTISTSPSNNNTNAVTAAASGNASSSRLPDQQFPHQGVTSPLSNTPTPTFVTTSLTSRTKGDKKSATRANLSRDARVIKTRIRRLWMDPTQEEHSRTRRDPKNQYLLLEESLTGILQIVPPIIENARIPNSSPIGLSYPTAYSDLTSNNSSHPRIMPMSMDISAAADTNISPLSPPHPLSVHPCHPLPPASLVGSAPSKSSGGSTTNSMTTTTTGPIHTHTRARTTSSNSTSTISATRYQIATSMLQPSEPLLMDIAQPTLRSPTSGASIGEPSLSTIAAAAGSPSNSPSTITGSRSTTSHMAESNKILISKLLSLSNTFTGSIRALCEQQNEKVLRFDDDMILELLTRWEQEAGKEEEEEEEEEEGSVPELDDSSSTTSLVTLGATNALERYQIIVGRVWEETDVILSCIRKIRDLVEFGRIQHYSDFDDEDSEEDAIEKDEIIKKSLYSRLLFHANGLVTVLGEFLECVSGIQRLVSTIKTHRKSQEIASDELCLNNGSSLGSNGFEENGQQSSSVVDFISDDPIPVKHLDPALMRKLKRKTRFKTITEKVRRSFSDFAKRSTTSLLAVFPPLGDGTNEGFHWDSYSDGEYYSEEWVGTEWGSSLAADEDSVVRTLSPPDSPGIKSETFYSRHRRLSSKDSSGMPEQYWPGSTRLGLSEDDMSPTNSIHPASPFSTSSSSIPNAGSSSNGGGFVDGTSMAMSRSMSSERNVNTIATRLYIGSSNNVVSPTRQSLESLRESMELTEVSSAGVDTMVMAASHSPTSPTQTGVKEKRQSLLFRRKSIQAPTFTGVSISTPIPIVSRPYSLYSSPGESQTPSRNKYRARPPRPPGSLPPMPPSPIPAESSRGDSFDASAGSDSTGSIFKTKSTHRTSSYLASRSISPLQSSPLILDSPFTRQTSIRMGNDRNRYSVKMPEDEQWDQLSRSNTISSTNGSSSNGSNNTPHSSSSNFPGSFWRRRSYNDALEKSWQSMRQDSISLFSGRGFNTSSPTTPSSHDFRSSFDGVDLSSSQSSVRVTSFEFMIPFFSRDGNMASSASSSRQGSRPGSGSALSQSGSERMMMSMVGNNRRHSSPLILGAERALADALSRRQSVSSQQSHSTSNSQPQQQQQQSQCSSNRNSVHMMPMVDEKSKPQSAPPPRQNPEQDSVQAQAQKPTVAHGSVQFMESDPLSIPPRPRPTYKKATPESSSHSNGLRHNGPYVATSKATAENSNGYREPGPLESRIPIDPSRKPVIGPRFGDMKKAWEILNLDVKRLNQYSHMRAYAKGQTVQNNDWALSHPNALQSTTSPRVLHICENGTDVLVMEMFEGYLQVVAGLLEKLIERLADENAQDAEYVSCFLLSHSFFIDSEDLLDRLIARFHIQPRQGEILYFEKWQTVIQVKILCVLMRWILIQYEDFELNANLLKTLRKFLEVDVRQAGFVMEAECIEKNISIKSLAPIKNCSVIMEQGRFCLQRSRTRKISLSRSQSPPSQSASGGILTSSSSKLEPVPQSPVEQVIEYGPTPELAASSPILQLNGQDLARYLTLADMKAFRSITVFELMSGWWKRRQAADNKRSSVGMDEDELPKSPSGLSVVEIDGAEDGAIEAFTRRANMLSYWVAHEIVSTAGSKTRKQLIKKFIEVAKICRQLNNLHTSMFIVSALTSKAVRRLSSSWKLVSSKDMETLKNLEALMDPSGNMRCYRQAIAQAEAPTIPFLPILLKDITFILDGNPTMIASKANLSTQPQAGPATSSTTSTSTPTSGSTTPITATETRTPSKDKNVGAPLVNFDKFRRLTQYVENAVDMAKSVDYSFEHQLLRQARVFRPSSPSLYGETESLSGHGGGSSLLGGKSGSSHGFHFNGSSNGGTGPAPDGSRGALDHISEMVERRLVKASGLYGVHQRVIQVEFINRAPGSKSSGGSSLWKSSSGGGGDGGSNVGSIHGSIVGNGMGNSAGLGSSGGDMVIRAVQGEEDYLIGLSRMCEPARW